MATQDELRKLGLKLPLSPGFIKANTPNGATKPRNGDCANGLCPPKQEQAERVPLERSTQRKDESCPRFEICFRIYARRPNDWDNPWIKTIQDLLVKSGILHDDNWRILQGKVITKKAFSEEEERTEITLTQIYE